MTTATRHEDGRGANANQKKGDRSRAVALLLLLEEPVFVGGKSNSATFDTRLLPVS